MTNTATANIQTPAYRIKKADTGVTIYIDLPGVSKEAVSLTTEKQQLVVSARRESIEQDGWNLVNQVQRPDSYELKLNAHNDLNLSSASAKLENGVLQVQLTKREESLPRQIDIAD
jgi:HSP20 family molecular chaperone IbpA